jgi:hypothetical protein
MRHVAGCKDWEEPADDGDDPRWPKVFASTMADAIETAER